MESIALEKLEVVRTSTITKIVLLHRASSYAQMVFTVCSPKGSVTSVEGADTVRLMLSSPVLQSVPIIGMHNIYSPRKLYHKTERKKAN